MFNTLKLLLHITKSGYLFRRIFWRKHECFILLCCKGENSFILWHSSFAVTAEDNLMTQDLQRDCPMLWLPDL